MNCLELRRTVLSDPRRPGAEAAAHAAACAACREFLARSLEDEAELDRALRVAVPEGLQDRVLRRARATRARVRWLALAASVVVAIAFAVVWPRDDALALAGIDFVMFDEAQSIADAAPTDWGALAAAARDMGVSLPRALGEMRYVCVYPLAAGAAHHLLVKTPLGKLTLLLIPDRASASRAAGAAYGFNAAVLPARTGTVVIIGDSARSVRRAESLLRSV
jgi:hypothetical protein